MKKYIICILLSVFFTMTAACGQKETSDQSDHTQKNISMANLQESMFSADTTLPKMTTISSDDEQAELNFTYLSDLSYDMVDSYFYAYATDGTAEEIAVIKLKDKGDVSTMMDALHDHIKQRQGTFQEYAPEQVGMTEKAVITREDSYVALIISQKNGLVQKTFQSFFE